MAPEAPPSSGSVAAPDLLPRMIPDEARCDSTWLQREEGARLPSRGRVRWEMFSQILFHQRHLCITTAHHGVMVAKSAFARCAAFVIRTENGSFQDGGSPGRRETVYGAEQVHDLIRKRSSSLDWDWCLCHVRLPSSASLSTARVTTSNSSL